MNTCTISIGAVLIPEIVTRSEYAELVEKDELNRFTMYIVIPDDKKGAVESE